MSAQNEYSLLERGVERELVPALRAVRSRAPAVLPARQRPAHREVHRRGDRPPGTRLAGAQYDAELSSRRFDVVEALEAFAADRGISLLDVAIGGLAARPAVASVIAGATRPEQVRANAEAARWVPTAADAEALEAVLTVTAGRD